MGCRSNHASPKWIIELKRPLCPACNVAGMGATPQVLAGMVSAVFGGSFGNIALANVGNTVHSVYVFHLPPGPIWFLHAFYVVSSALMLYWFLRSRSVRREHSGATT